MARNIKKKNKKHALMNSKAMYLYDENGVPNHYENPFTVILQSNDVLKKNVSQLKIQKLKNRNIYSNHMGIGMRRLKREIIHGSDIGDFTLPELLHPIRVSKQKKKDSNELNNKLRLNFLKSLYNDRVDDMNKTLLQQENIINSKIKALTLKNIALNIRKNRYFSSAIDEKAYRNELLRYYHQIGSLNAQAESLVNDNFNTVEDLEYLESCRTFFENCVNFYDSINDVFRLYPTDSTESTHDEASALLNTLYKDPEIELHRKSKSFHQRYSLIKAHYADSGIGRCKRSSSSFDNRFPLLLNVHGTDPEIRCERSSSSFDNKSALLNVHYKDCEFGLCKKSSYYSAHVNYPEIQNKLSGALNSFNEAIDTFSRPSNVDELMSPEYMKNVFDFIDQFIITQMEALAEAQERNDNLACCFKRSKVVEDKQNVVNKLKDDIKHKESLLSHLYNTYDLLNQDVFIRDYKSLFNFGKMDVSSFDSILQQFVHHASKLYYLIHDDTNEQPFVASFEELVFLLKHVEMFVDSSFVELNKYPVAIRRIAYSQLCKDKAKRKRAQHLKECANRKSLLRQKVIEKAAKPVVRNKGRRLMLRSVPKPQIKKKPTKPILSKYGTIYDYSFPFKE